MLASKFGLDRHRDELLDFQPATDFGLAQHE
jgi:hypothetical protein